MSEANDRKRERRIAAMKTQILEAAARLFAEQGFHRTTTSNIAQAAEVSEGTLYNYFESKDALLMGIVQMLVDNQRLQEQYANALPEEARSYLKSVLHERKQFLDQNMYFVRSIFSEILVNPELRQQYRNDLLLPSIQILEQHLEQRKAGGQLSNIDPAFSARILSSLMFGLMLMQVLDEPVVESQWEPLEDYIVKTIFEGLS